IWPLNSISIPFFPSLLIAGTVTAFLAFLMGFPVFRVHGDYLAIVTLGFGEIVRVLANNAISLTNGALGLKGIATYTNLWWSWGWAIFVLFCIMRIVNSSYGRAMKAVREDELAAKAMGINAFRTKMLAFVLCGFFEGVGGGLLAHLITTISPVLFTFFLTFNLLIIIVIGGLGSITGSVIAAVAFAWGFEILRVVEEPMNFGFIHIPGIPGMRMVVFALILLVVMLFAPHGIMGRNEFTWDGLFRGMAKARNRLFGR
ncbi:MAG: branched-chain amino acid ABC transporter permease, partial [Nitrospinota bacterium]